MHQSLYMGYLLAMTRDLDAAEEIFQNVAVAMMDSAPKEPVRDFKAWGKEVVRRQALRYFESKRQHRMKPIDPALAEVITTSFFEDDCDAQRARGEAEALRKCIDELPEKSRSMFVLRYEQRATFADIALHVQSTSTAVQRALYRLRKALHTCVRTRLQRGGETSR
jgi:RNA polymerase sigma-70 factor (ECF subfamily)